VPAIFTGVMALGAVAGYWIGLIPGIDQGAAASVLVLGLLIATATRIPAGAGFALVSLFAIFHGFAHGAEMPATSGVLGHGLGFIVASLLLNAAGLGLGFTAARFSNHASRWIGWGFAAAGLAVLAG
jgi:urease accessory protein